jgi:uncharacterized membrane protein YheB (UPF0754 family)
MTTQTQGLDLESYVDKLLEEKKLPEGLEQDVLDQMRKDLMKRVQNRINAAILANLTEDQMEEFNKLLDEDNEENTQKFLEENIADFAEMIATELIVFKQTYLG